MQIIKNNIYMLCFLPLLPLLPLLSFFVVFVANYSKHIVLL